MSLFSQHLPLSISIETRNSKKMESCWNTLNWDFSVFIPLTMHSHLCIPDCVVTTLRKRIWCISLRFLLFGLVYFWKYCHSCILWGYFCYLKNRRLFVPYSFSSHLFFFHLSLCEQGGLGLVSAIYSPWEESLEIFFVLEIMNCILQIWSNVNVKVCDIYIGCRNCQMFLMTVLCYHWKILQWIHW